MTISLNLKHLTNTVNNVLPEIETIYKDLHQHPELSMQEVRTAGVVADFLRQFNFIVTEKVGETGVVGILKNGCGNTVMLRADMDALPIQECTGLPYASTQFGTLADGKTVPLMHACGHDLHTACLLGVAKIFAQNTSYWQGTLMVVFQPAEETAKGALAMLNDNMLTRFPKPTVIFGQHVMPYPAGTIHYRSGQVMASGDSLLIHFFGQGSHGSQPQNSIDPIVMAAHSVIRLQTIVSREIHPNTSAVVTVGEFHAGTAENIIPAEAYIKLNIRTTDENVRNHILAAVKRICTAEAQASNAPKLPEFIEINSFPLTINDVTLTENTAKHFNAYFGDKVKIAEPLAGSEDFSRFGRAWQVPYFYWFIGGIAPDQYVAAEKAGTVQQTIPQPHSPFYAPVLDISLKTGIEAMLVAATSWLDKTDNINK